MLAHRFTPQRRPRLLSWAPQLVLLALWCVLPVGAAWAQSVTSFTLINAQTDEPIPGYDPIPPDATLNLATLPTTRLNVRANTDGGTVGSVRFGYDDDETYRTESDAPFACFGDKNGDYRNWTPTLGLHTIQATPFSKSRASGTRGTTLTLRFSVVNQAGEPDPEPEPEPDPDPPPPTPGGVAVTGELRTWHRVTLTFDGPQVSELGAPTPNANPFRDYRLNVTFTHGSRRIVVPGFFAADGNAANSGAAAGSKWRVHFAPDAVGTWTYVASFRSGADIAASTDPDAGAPTGFHGVTGSFNVAATNKSGRDHRAKGQLRYVGGHYLRYAQTGEYFLKGGANSPENLLAFVDFDGTFEGSDPLHVYAPHAADWRPGDPTWRDGKGKNIIGAINYLASEGMNAVYFLTMNINGDGDDVSPWITPSERYRYDCSKLDQWEIVFRHMKRKGIMLHVVTQEQENDQLLDGGALGVQRRIYYRELIARFAHNLAITWNLGEETTNTDAQRKAFAQYIRDLDPYDHPISVHTYTKDYETVYEPLLGFPSFEVLSIQGTATRELTETWRELSADADRPWVIAIDEIGPSAKGVLPDAVDPAHDKARELHLWGNLMYGGGGCEWYFGGAYDHDDTECEDWRSRDLMWDQTRYALTFFRTYLPFWEMIDATTLSSNGKDFCFAKVGHTYAIYLRDGGTTSLDLRGVSGDFTVHWFEPRNGGELQLGSVRNVTGGAWASLGTAPSEPEKDWVILVRRVN